MKLLQHLLFLFTNRIHYLFTIKNTLSATILRMLIHSQFILTQIIDHEMIENGHETNGELEKNMTRKLSRKWPEIILNL